VASLALPRQLLAQTDPETLLESSSFKKEVVV
jgi:hypothetical protein